MTLEYGKLYRFLHWRFRLIKIALQGRARDEDFLEHCTRSERFWWTFKCVILLLTQPETEIATFDAEKHNAIDYGESILIAMFDVHHGSHIDVPGTYTTWFELRIEKERWRWGVVDNASA